MPTGGTRSSRRCPGWRLLAPDLRGHGESGWAEPPAYAVGDFAADLGAWIDAHAPGRVALVGHSMGGRVALGYAAHHPERVRGLVLLDTRLTPVEPERAAVWRASVAGKRHGRTYPTREEALAAFRFVPDERHVPAVIVADLAHHAVVAVPPGDWTFRFDRAVLSIDGDRAGDLTPLLRARCPLLLLAADSWVMGPEQRGSAPVTIFPGAHHFLSRAAAEAGRRCVRSSIGSRPDLRRLAARPAALEPRP